MRSDNGPEFAAEGVRSWLEETRLRGLYIAPACPWQKGYAEAFHGLGRDVFLSRVVFVSESQARALGSA